MLAILIQRQCKRLEAQLQDTAAGAPWQPDESKGSRSGTEKEEEPDRINIIKKRLPHRWNNRGRGNERTVEHGVHGEKRWRCVAWCAPQAPRAVRCALLCSALFLLRCLVLVSLMP